MKKFLSVFLSVLMVLSICPVFVFAADTFNVTFTDLDFAKDYRTDAVGREGYTLGRDYWFAYKDASGKTVEVKTANTSVPCEQGKPFVFTVVVAPYIDASTVRAVAYPTGTQVTMLYDSTGAFKSAYSLDINQEGTFAFYVNKDMDVTLSEYHLFNTGFSLKLPTSKYYNVVRLDKTNKGDIGPTTEGVRIKTTYLVSLEGFDITNDALNTTPIDATNITDNLLRITAINEQANYDANLFFSKDKSSTVKVRYDRNTFNTRFYFISYKNSMGNEVTEKWHLTVEQKSASTANCVYEALSGSSFDYIQSTDPEVYYHTVDAGNSPYVIYTNQSLYFMISLTVAGVQYARDEETDELKMKVAIKKGSEKNAPVEVLEPVWTSPDGLSFIYEIKNCTGNFSISVNNAYGFTIDMIKEIVTSIQSGDFDFGDVISGNGSISGGSIETSGIIGWFTRILNLIASLLKAFGLNIDLSGIQSKLPSGN